MAVIEEKANTQSVSLCKLNKNHVDRWSLHHNIKQKFFKKSSTIFFFFFFFSVTRICRILLINVEVTIFPSVFNISLCLELSEKLSETHDQSNSNEQRATALQQQLDQLIAEQEEEREQSRVDKVTPRRMGKIKLHQCAPRLQNIVMAEALRSSFLWWGMWRAASQWRFLVCSKQALKTWRLAHRKVQWLISRCCFSKFLGLKMIVYMLNRFTPDTWISSTWFQVKLEQTLASTQATLESERTSAKAETSQLMQQLAQNLEIQKSYQTQLEAQGKASIVSYELYSLCLLSLLTRSLSNSNMPTPFSLPPFFLNFFSFLKLSYSYSAYTQWPWMILKVDLINTPAQKPLKTYTRGENRNKIETKVQR